MAILPYGHILTMTILTLWPSYREDIDDHEGEEDRDQHLPAVLPHHLQHALRVQPQLQRRCGRLEPRGRRAVDLGLGSGLGSG